MTDALSLPACDATAAWAALQNHYEQSAHAFDLREAFRTDTRRFASFSQEAPHLFADLSKNLLDERTEALLMQLARERGLERQRDAMFGGEAINTTERRAVKHWLLRAPAGASRDADAAQVQATLEAMLAYAEQVRSDAAITDVVNIGIGGSDLGPQMAVAALESVISGRSAR